MKRIIQKQFILLFFLFSHLTFAGNVTPGNLFAVKNSSTNLIINTTIPNHTYTRAGIKLLTSGFSIEGAGIVCENAPSGYCTFTVSDIQNKVLNINGPVGSYLYNLCLDGVNQISCQQYGSPGVATEKFAYIANWTSNVINLCNIGAEGGTFTTCNNALTLSNTPASTIIDRLNNRIYFTGPFSNVTHCKLNSTNGIISNCSTQIIGSYAYQNIAINATATFAYLSDANGNIFACPINSADGSLTSCNLSTNIGAFIWGTALTNNRFYLARASDIYKCNVNLATGQISQCASTLGGFAYATDITLNPSKTKAYISDCTNNTVSTCAVSSATGNLSNCVVADTEFVCPFHVMINNAGTIAYVANYSSNNVMSCEINKDTGLLNSCNDNTLGFSGPISGELY